MSLVSLTKTLDGHFATALQQALDLIKFTFNESVREVVVKPNLCYYWDASTGQTTDPMFTKAVVDLVQTVAPDAHISIVESDASAMKCSHAFRMLGYEKVFQNMPNVQLVNLSEDSCKSADVNCGGHKFRFTIPETISSADLKINIPKIKYTMEPIKLTCALKNIYGCNPYPKKYKYHPQLGEVIVAINKAMRFDLVLTDANIVSGIQPRKLGLVMASQDPVAIDSAAAKIAGINPRTIKYLQLAKREGLGSTTFVPKGESVDFFKANYPKKNFNKKLMNRAYSTVLTLGLGRRLGLE